MHNLSLITTIAAGFTTAWLLGLMTQRIRLSPIVGYLIAGVLIGPHTPGFVGDNEIAQQLAEVGVILMMFGVGLHFHLKDLYRVKGVAIPGAIGQSLTATILAIVVFGSLGVPVETGAVLGMAMAVASTVVLMRVLLDANVLNSPQGHIAVGWLIVEDILTVILLVLIPALGEGDADHAEHASPDSPLWVLLGLALLKLAAMVVVVIVGGSRIVPWILVQVARLRSRELFTLTILVLSIAIAAGSYLVFGASMALGAFLAGMVVAQSPLSHQAAAEVLPFRDAFAVLFFVAVGMLFDPWFLVEEPLLVLGALGIILLAKPIAALTIVALLGHSSKTALTVALGLAQIGEFSFILSDLARRYGLMSEAGHHVLVAGAILSITINPLLFQMIPSIQEWLRKHPSLWRLFNARAERWSEKTNLATARYVEKHTDSETGLAIVVGYGPVGRAVHRMLREAGLRTVIVDLNMDTVQALNGEGQAAIFGNASHESILEQAGVRNATHVVVTLPDSSERAAVVAAVRGLNQRARILVRARYLNERHNLEQAGASAAVFEEGEAAVALARLVLTDTGVRRQAAEHKINDLRLQLIMENVSGIRTLKVRSVMVPWSQVRWLSSSADRPTVLAQVSEERFSRWPVLEPRTGRAVGYLLTKDLIARAADSDWHQLIRPITSVMPGETVDGVLSRMQSEGDTVYVVESEQQLVGLITLEDILEQVVGQIEDEYPHQAVSSLSDAVARGAVITELEARTSESAIRELVEAIPPRHLPPNMEAAEILHLVLEREDELSTNLGNGIAVPHARIPGLEAPLVVFGRSSGGVLFPGEEGGLVHLMFLLLTPTEQPDLQLSLLSQVSRACSDPERREQLLQAASLTDVNLSLVL